MRYYLHIVKLTHLSIHVNDFWHIFMYLYLFLSSCIYLCICYKHLKGWAFYTNSRWCWYCWSEDHILNSKAVIINSDFNTPNWDNSILYQCELFDFYFKSVCDILIISFEWKMKPNEFKRYQLGGEKLSYFCPPTYSVSLWGLISCVSFHRYFIHRKVIIYLYFPFISIFTHMVAVLEKYFFIDAFLKIRFYLLLCNSS